tara:strand:+ start:629 stop:1051 length:423 start_codon:yes stop_codon:yes gene_type:complete
MDSLKGVGDTLQNSIDMSKAFVKQTIGHIDPILLPAYSLLKERHGSILPAVFSVFKALQGVDGYEPPVKALIYLALLVIFLYSIRAPLGLAQRNVLGFAQSSIRRKTSRRSRRSRKSRGSRKSIRSRRRGTRKSRRKTQR